MKRSASRRVWPLVLSSTLLAGAFGVAACVGDEGTTATPDGGGGLDGSSAQETSTSTPTEDATTTPEVDGGEEIADGGGLPPEEEDGGVTDPDGGFDAGPACQPLTSGAYVQSKCAIISKVPGGGALTSGTYELMSVTALGSKAYCADGGGYVAYDHRGALEIAATSATAATFEFVDQYKKSGGIVIRPTTLRYDVSVSASGTTLTYTAQPCALKPAPASALYSVGTVTETGKKTITLRLPYGTGSANFYYVQK